MIRGGDHTFVIDFEGTSKSFERLEEVFVVLGNHIGVGTSQLASVDDGVRIEILKNLFAKKEKRKKN